MPQEDQTIEYKIAKCKNELEEIAKKLDKVKTAHEDIYNLELRSEEMSKRFLAKFFEDLYVLHKNIWWTVGGTLDLHPKWSF